MSHLTKVAFCVFCFFMLTFFYSSNAAAQHNDPPSGQFGLGVYAISTSLPSGLEGTYAINQNVQVGTGFSLSVNSGIYGSGTVILFSPFARYLFSSSVSPFLQGGLQVLSVASSSNVGIFLGGGVGYYLDRKVGVTAGVDILNTFFSPSGTAFGWGIVRVAADWFF